jgi:hypothetical protein
MSRALPSLIFLLPLGLFCILVYLSPVLTFIFNIDLKITPVDFSWLITIALKVVSVPLGTPVLTFVYYSYVFLPIPLTVSVP